MWNASSGVIVKVFSLHAGPVLDVDWRDSDSFATCSSDRCVFVWHFTCSVFVFVFPENCCVLKRGWPNLHTCIFVFCSNFCIIIILQEHLHLPGVKSRRKHPLALPLWSRRWGAQCYNLICFSFFDTTLVQLFLVFLENPSTIFITTGSLVGFNVLTLLLLFCTVGQCGVLESRRWAARLLLWRQVNIPLLFPFPFNFA